MGKYSVASDPRGLIFEAYRIDGITSKDCRSIFFDWALGLQSDLNPISEVETLYQIYVKDHPGHPMNKVLEEGLVKLRGHPKRKSRGAK
tara:strand:+ start:513 stop:779 length:267 start_codon:yes stop_codon:yes gene_type:complete